MSQLRSALGAAALTTSDPAGVIDILERYARSIPGSACTTVAYAVIDGDGQGLTYTCAGHPYPLVLAPDGTTRYLTDGRRPPLGVRAFTAPNDSGRSVLAPGSVMVLYTDGLIERPGESLDTGFSRLAAVATACRQLPAAELCATLLERMAPEGGYLDDVAIVAVRPVGTTPDSFATVIRADITAGPIVRHQLRNWLPELGLPDDTIGDVLIAVGEAVNNAILHGSQLDPERTVAVEVFAEADRIQASVTDSGHWVRDSSASRRDTRGGRGLTLIHGLSDQVTLVRGNLGTRITMTFPTIPTLADG
jgi:anti-sigma regulatory factor (Ser/Thr protein kinase)